MTYLRDIGRQTPIGTPVPIENWLLGPVEFAIYKQLRRLKIDTGIKLSKINILGTSNPQPYRGECFDGCTVVQLDADWTEIACLPRNNRVETAVITFSAGISVVLDHFGLTKENFYSMIKELNNKFLEINIKLGSFQSNKETFSLFIYWKATMDFAQLRVSQTASKNNKFTVIAEMWPDFESIKPADIHVESGHLQIKCFAGFFSKTLLGRKYLEPSGGVGHVVYSNENKSVTASFDIELISKQFI